MKKRVWKDSTVEEYESIVKNGIWDVVPRPKEKYLVTSKWLIENYQEKFMERGFSQKEGEDYHNILAPIACYTTIRSIVAHATT